MPPWWPWWPSFSLHLRCRVPCTLHWAHKRAFQPPLCHCSTSSWYFDRFRSFASSIHSSQGTVSSINSTWRYWCKHDVWPQLSFCDEDWKLELFWVHAHVVTMLEKILPFENTFCCLGNPLLQKKQHWLGRLAPEDSDDRLQHYHDPSGQLGVCSSENVWLKHRVGYYFCFI